MSIGRGRGWMSRHWERRPCLQPGTLRPWPRCQCGLPGALEMWLLVKLSYLFKLRATLHLLCRNAIRCACRVRASQFAARNLSRLREMSDELEWTVRNVRYSDSMFDYSPPYFLPQTNRPCIRNGWTLIVVTRKTLCVDFMYFWLVASTSNGDSEALLSRVNNRIRVEKASKQARIWS